MAIRKVNAPNCDVAIVFGVCRQTGELKTLKYRNLSRHPATRARFVKFLLSKFHLQTINWYDQDLPKGRNFRYQQRNFT